MVTHDMGSIIKYCDKVILLNKGEYIAEGPAGRMVDLYKKILAGQMESLREELASRREGVSEDAPGRRAGAGGSEPGGLMREKLTINANREEDGRA